MTSPTEELKSLGASIGRFKAMLHWKKQELAYFPKHYSGADADELKCYISDIENILGRIAELEGENEKQRETILATTKHWKASENRVSDLRENSRFKAEFHKTKPVSKIEIENIKLKTEIERLEARIEILENPSDGRCMEIGALREEVERLKKIVENGSVTIESYGLELTQNRKQLATAKEALLDIRPRAQNYLATGIVARIDEALEKLK